MLHRNMWIIATFQSRFLVRNVVWYTRWSAQNAPLTCIGEIGRTLGTTMKRKTREEAIQVLRNAILPNIGPSSSLGNANSVEPYTFVTLFSGKSDTPLPSLHYVTIKWPLSNRNQSKKTVIHDKLLLSCDLRINGSNQKEEQPIKED